MRVVFMGTPAFAVPSLKHLAAEHEVALVLTRPDAVRSRGRKLEPSPVKVAALELGLPVLEAKRITPEVLDALASANADVFCVAAYGCILPDEVLTMTPLGCVNVHASLLPRWHGVDTGAYCAQASCSVPGKTADELTAELAELGGSLLVSVLPTLADGSAVWTEQDERLVTHAAKIEKSEMRLDPAMPATDNARRVLASSDAAPARCAVADKPVRILSTEVLDDVAVEQGTYSVSGRRVLLGCAEGVLEVVSLKPDGKRAMDASAWAAGLRDKQGAWGLLS